MAPFYGWGSTASKLPPLRGGSLLFTILFTFYVAEKKTKTYRTTFFLKERPLFGGLHPFNCLYL